MGTVIPKKHPRYHSLMTREKMSMGVEKGLVHETGLIAHGRGEAFDYLLSETTIPNADKAAFTAAALLLCAHHPVISLNGNVVVLAADACVTLSKIIPAFLEVNLFHRTESRVHLLIEEMKKHGAIDVLGMHAEKRIPGLTHNRGLCEENGIFSADVVLVPLEDGDRCLALKKMGKKVITIDLNPLSRTAQTADITIVDNVTRALPRIIYHVNTLKQKSKEELKLMIKEWDNQKNLHLMLAYVSKKLNSMGGYR